MEIGVNMNCETQLKTTGFDFEEFILEKIRERFRDDVIFKKPTRIKDINFFLSHAKPLTKEETKAVLVLLARRGDVEFISHNKVLIKK